MKTITGEEVATMLGGNFLSVCCTLSDTALRMKAPIQFLTFVQVHLSESYFQGRVYILSTHVTPMSMNTIQSSCNGNG